MLVFIKSIITFMHRHYFVCFCLWNELVGNNHSSHANGRLYSTKSDITKQLFFGSFTFWRFGEACNYLTGGRNPQHAESDLSPYYARKYHEWTNFTRNVFSWQKGRNKLGLSANIFNNIFILLVVDIF